MRDNMRLPYDTVAGIAFREGPFWSQALVAIAVGFAGGWLLGGVLFLLERF